MRLPHTYGAYSYCSMPIRLTVQSAAAAIFHWVKELRAASQTSC